MLVQMREPAVGILPLRSRKVLGSQRDRGDRRSDEEEGMQEGYEGVYGWRRERLREVGGRREQSQT